MELSFYYTPSEITAAYQKHYRKLINTGKDVGMAIATLVLGLLIQHYAGMNLVSFFMYAMSIVFVLLPIGAIGIAPLIFARLKKFKGLQQWEIHTGSYTINGTTYSISELEEIKENEHQFRLYRGVNDFSILPKRCFSSLNEIAGFRKFFSKYLFTFE